MFALEEVFQKQTRNKLTMVPSQKTEIVFLALPLNQKCLGQFLNLPGVQLPNPWEKKE